ncbi:MAG: endosialidase [Lachnospiraceae bacterium]|nr:endosialidase [Lachnospiraceae bacterium]MCR5477770.1 endosialidase [Lachnospiraceae bacterium]
MATELLRTEEGGKLSFGDYTLPAKSKVEDYPHGGDLLKCKSFKEITKLEKNGLFLYESVPGTSVEGFEETEDGISFTVRGAEDAQITLGLAEDTVYEVFVGGESTGAVQTGLGGKLSISVELSGEQPVSIEVRKA